MEKEEVILYDRVIIKVSKGKSLDRYMRKDGRDDIIKGK